MTRSLLFGVLALALAPAAPALAAPATSALAPASRPQLDLPSRPPAPRPVAPAGLSDDARELYERAADVRAANERARGGRSSDGQLDLPATPRRPAPAAGDPEPAPEPVPAPLPPADPLADPSALPAPAAALVAELAALASSNDRAAREAAAKLVAAGPDGLAAARVAVASDHAPSLLLAGRLLAVHGDATDHARLAMRLSGRFDGQLGAQLLRATATAAPAAIADRFLVELLEHPQAALRLAAERQLVARARAELVPTLVPALHSERADTRLRAVEVLGRIDDPSSATALLSRLDDPATRVATRAAELVGAHPWEELDRKLPERVFALRTLFREQAYALLAIVQREDATGRALLDELHAPALVENSTSALPVVSGACALALAGIGFRSDDRVATRWLDLDVPHELVRVLVGETFHKDFSALQGPARRRLSLLSGEDFGADGPAWREWWASEARHFKARRAVLSFRPEDAAGIAVTWRRPGALDPLVLLGPDAPAPARGASDPLLLSRAQAEALVAELDAAGVFGSERPPGTVGDGQPIGLLEVRLAGQGKVFQLGDRALPAWIDTVRDALLAHAEANRWQRFYDPSAHASRRAFVDAEAPWWAETRTAEERDRRAKDLALAALAGAGALERGPMVAELEALARRDGLLGPADFQPLVDALAVEPFFGPRATTLARLATDAAGGGPSGEAVDPGAVRALLETLVRAFGPAARPAIEEAFAAAPIAMVRTSALDQRTLLRELAAAPLARSRTPEDIELLRALLGDADATVEAAAVAAIGDAGVVELRGEVLGRARIARPDVRRAALIALGQLGGDGALEILRESVGAEQGTLDAAAAEALGELGDARAAAVLVVLLHGGPGSPAFDATTAALRQLGPPAWTELMRVAQSPSGPARRGAALVLAEQGVPPVVPVLIQLLAEDPRDANVKRELVALTGVDFSDDVDPLGAWWDWWDRAPKDDSRVWLRAAQEAHGLPVGPLDGWGGDGTRAGAESLLVTIERGPPALALRATRELGRMLDEPLEQPTLEPERSEWLADLRRRAAERWSD